MTTDHTPPRHTCHDRKAADGPAGACPRCSPPVTDHTPSAGTSFWVDRDPLMEAIAAAVWDRCRTEDGLVVDDPRNIAVAALAAVPSPPADRAAVLDAASALIKRHCPDHGPDDQDGVWMDCRCAVVDDMRKRAAELRRMADETQPAPCSCGVLRAGPGRHLAECPNQPARAVRTPCSVPECDVDGTGEPCDRHEREDSHAEGNHELCGANCPAAAERQDGAPS